MMTHFIKKENKTKPTKTKKQTTHNMEYISLD